METLQLFFVSKTLLTYICPPMKNKRTENLLQKSRELFMKFGIKNLTMDDIARELCMSKKTIYQSVDNKAELVERVIQNYLEEENVDLDKIYARADNAIDEIIAIIDYFIERMRGLNSTAVHDMKKHYPEAWSHYNTYRFNNALRRITENLMRGIKEGAYRADMNATTIARIYLGGIDNLLSPEYFPVPEYHFIEVYKEYQYYHLRGIVTEQGLKILEANNLFTKQETK